MEKGEGGGEHGREGPCHFHSKCCAYMCPVEEHLKKAGSGIDALGIVNWHLDEKMPHLPRILILNRFLMNKEPWISHLEPVECTEAPTEFC